MWSCHKAANQLGKPANHKKISPINHNCCMRYRGKLSYIRFMLTLKAAPTEIFNTEILA